MSYTIQYLESEMAAQNLEVTVLSGGPDVVPEDVVARGGAEIA